MDEQRPSAAASAAQGFRPTKELVVVAQSQPRQALPTETHQSYPIPVLADGRLALVFLYCPTRLDIRDGLHLTTPDFLAQVDARDGRFDELRAVTPAELGVVGEPGKDIGLFMLPAGLSRQQYLDGQHELFESLDRLYPAFVEQRTSVSAGERRAARRVLELWGVVTEPPLKSYYSVIGERFFAWVRRATSP